jgi:hypothetical protein
MTSKPPLCWHCRSNRAGGPADAALPRRFGFFGPVTFELGLLTLQVTAFDADWHLLLLKERRPRDEQAHSHLQLFVDSCPTPT